MTDESKKNETHPDDPSLKWPLEVKQAYEHLKIPSLYDCLLANEKMSLEVRKQNRDVKSAVEGMQKIATVLDSLMQVISDEWIEVDEENEGEIRESRGSIIEVPEHNALEDYDNLSEFEVQLLADKQLLQNQTHAILIEAMDSTYELNSLAQQLSQQIFKVIPDKEEVPKQSPSWYPLIEKIIHSYVTHVSHYKNRFQARLVDMGLHVIDPKPGEVFDKDIHINLEEVSGGETGTIAQVIRVGYRYNELLLRHAEVIVFN